MFVIQRFYCIVIVKAISIITHVYIMYVCITVELNPHNNAIFDVAWLPEGKQIVSCNQGL